jgi:Ca2+-transporting ATPase
MTIVHPVEEILSDLNVDPAYGLSEEDAKSRLEKSGLNKLIIKKKDSKLRLFIRQLQDWLIYVLFAAVIITLIMGEYVDVIIIALVILINAFLGVIQEVKAAKAIDALRKMFLPKAIVRRNGIALTIESEKVVTGDILC